jgi:transcription elongation factor GreA
MNNQKVQMTPTGYQQLLAELEELQNNKLPQAIDRVATARAFGDLSENAEYHSARDDLSAMEGRIEELKDIIARSEVIDAPQANSGEVSIGSVVHVEVNGSEHQFTIVGEWEADPSAKKISHESPLGKSLVGKKIGEVIEVEAPAGKVHYQIKDVK